MTVGEAPVREPEHAPVADRVEPLPVGLRHTGPGRRAEDRVARGGEVPAEREGRVGRRLDVRVGARDVRRGLTGVHLLAVARDRLSEGIAYLKEHGTDWQPGPVLGPMDIFRRVGFDWWHGIEEKFAR